MIYIFLEKAHKLQEIGKVKPKITSVMKVVTFTLQLGTRVSDHLNSITILIKYLLRFRN